MNMIIAQTILLALSCLLLLVLLFRKTDNGATLTQRKVEELEKALNRIEQSLREDFRMNREDNNKLARENRFELKAALDQHSRDQSEKVQLLINSTEKRLDQMRETVDEKLQKTLNERLGQSFEMVGKQLESVQKGLGEMQTLALDVGGLKKVLSNVKLRGNVGEVQLAMLLEQILAPNQYDANVKTKLGSADPVEFAVKLPGRSEDENSIVYLPIDAKFPKDVYEQLLAAYDIGTLDAVELATKNMETAIKKMAKDKAVTEKTIVFNNLINNIAEYNESWEVPAMDSWHSRFF
jgi:DNA recombination protein RmuC